jgi:hypothetical protein
MTLLPFQVLYSATEGDLFAQGQIKLQLGLAIAQAARGGGGEGEGEVRVVGVNEPIHPRVKLEQGAGVGPGEEPRQQTSAKVQQTPQPRQQSRIKRERAPRTGPLASAADLDGVGMVYEQAGEEVMVEEPPQPRQAMEVEQSPPPEPTRGPQPLPRSTSCPPPPAATPAVPEGR